MLSKPTETETADEGDSGEVGVTRGNRRHANAKATNKAQVADGGGGAGRCGRAWLVFVVALLLILAIDLGIKQWAFATVAGDAVSMALVRSGDPGAIGYHEPVVWIPGIFAFHLTVNRGAVFGLGHGSQWLFIAVSVIAVGVVVRVFWVSLASAWLFHAGLGMLLGGALGNMYDRLRFMAVRDMLFLFPDVHLPFGWHWPGGNNLLYPWIFNIADVALLAGVLLLFVLSWRGVTDAGSGECGEGDR